MCVASQKIPLASRLLNSGSGSTMLTDRSAVTFSCSRALNETKWSPPGLAESTKAVPGNAGQTVRPVHPLLKVTSSSEVAAVSSMRRSTRQNGSAPAEAIVMCGGVCRSLLPHAGARSNVVRGGRLAWRRVSWPSLLCNTGRLGAANARMHGGLLPRTSRRAAFQPGAL